MDPVVFHAPVSRHSPWASTVARPAFQRDPLDDTQVGQGGEFYHRAASTPTAPHHYPPERSALRTTITRKSPGNALLAEGIPVALRYNADPRDNFAVPSNARLEDYPTQTDTHDTPNARGRLQTARRREQCRLNQARYRLRQDRKVQLLNETVTKLREEIPLLGLQRDRILFGTKQSIFNVVVEYFHLFRHGVRLGNYVPDSQTQHQQVFLRSAMCPNVLLGERQGVHALMEQWRRYSSYFEDLNFQLEHMDERLKNLVTVSASMTVTITEATLKHVFPHLVNSKLGETLLGRRLMLPCSLCFEWDDASSHVVQLEMTVDFLTPVNRVLNSLSDTAFVLGQALVTLDGSIGKFDTWE